MLFRSVALSVDPADEASLKGKQSVVERLAELACASGDFNRSEERRVGKECRFRWAPVH